MAKLVSSIAWGFVRRKSHGLPPRRKVMSRVTLVAGMTFIIPRTLPQGSEGRMAVQMLLGRGKEGKERMDPWNSGGSEMRETRRGERRVPGWRRCPERGGRVPLCAVMVLCAVCGAVLGIFRADACALPGLAGCSRGASPDTAQGVWGGAIRSGSGSSAASVACLRGSPGLRMGAASRGRSGARHSGGFALLLDL
jgi:hypothetical protein